MVSPLVSCICPTWNRQDRHASLYANFDSQRYPYKELLVCDDSARPSRFFQALRDHRVRYWHLPRRASIGGKRNALNTQAQGDVIVHLDDDDHYAPTYTETMVDRLQDCDLVKLSVFNIVNERDGSKWRWDTRTSGGAQSLISSKFSGLCIAVPFGWAATAVAKWGFGFSYVYRRGLWDAVRFPRIDRREDFEFVKRAHARGARLKHLPDCADLVWHSVHDASTSTTFPQVRLDGPSPIPMTNVFLGSVCGAVFGAVLGGPLGAIAGGVSATALTGAFARSAIGASSRG